MKQYKVVFNDRIVAVTTSVEAQLAAARLLLAEEPRITLVNPLEDVAKIVNRDAEYIAKVAHEVNRAYCQSLGDLSQPAWEDAPEWQKTSAINGVKHHVANPDTSPEESHMVWLKEKLETGWKYGPVKDAEKKEHPCCVAYKDLKESDKSKDYLFRAVVKQLK